MSTDAGIRRGAVVYLQIRLLSAPAVLLTVAAFGALRGLQDMRTPLWIAVATNALNVALDPLLIFGLGPLPALGIAGAAWATVIAQWLGAAAAVRAVRSGRACRRASTGATRGTCWRWGATSSSARAAARLHPARLARREPHRRRSRRGAPGRPPGVGVHGVRSSTPTQLHRTKPGSGYFLGAEPPRSRAPSRPAVARLSGPLATGLLLSGLMALGKADLWPRRHRP